MKKLLVLLVMVAVAGLCVTAAAQELEKTVILFRSMDDPDIPPDWSRCTEAIAGFNANFALGASLWSSNTRSNNGQVVKEKVRQIGTANACFLAGDFFAPPFRDETPFYVELTVGDLDITLEGECEGSINEFPAGPIFMGCLGVVIPEASTEGIKWGSAVTNTTFIGMPIPGLELGSFWSIQLVWE
jgi:hypothetical protein